MKAMRRRRLERLEKLLLRRSEPWRGIPYDLCMSLLAELDAEATGRPFSWIPPPEVALSEAAEETFRARMQQADIIDARLANERG